MHRPIRGQLGILYKPGYGQVISAALVVRNIYMLETFPSIFKTESETQAWDTRLTAHIELKSALDSCQLPLCCWEFPCDWWFQVPRRVLCLFSDCVLYTGRLHCESEKCRILCVHLNPTGLCNKICKLSNY